MKKPIKSRKNESGQSLILVTIVIAALIGFAALVVDVGVLYNSKAELQNIADAAALAGAQDLPNASLAIDTALDYVSYNGLKATQNALTESGDTVTITTPYKGDETKIEVKCKREVPYLFAKIFGLSSTEISARSAAQYGIAASVPWIVPFVIPEPAQFNYDNLYVMRMYGAGPYPTGYNYPSDFLNDSLYKKYNITQNTYEDVYKTKNNSTIVYQSSSTNSTKVVTISGAGTKVTFMKEKRVSNVLWYRIRVQIKSGRRTNTYTGWVKAIDMNKTSEIINSTVTNNYPYQFDYMNVKIEAAQNMNDYLGYLENGYHKTYSVDEKMLYFDPSSGGKTSVDVFAKRVQKDSNTDYTKAKVGDPRVMLIPVVNELLPRNTRENTKITIIGFVAFYLEEVHKNSYGETFWFEGRFLENISIGSGKVTVDPDADFGLRVMQLVE